MNPRFQDLLHEYTMSATEDERERVEAALWLEFGAEHAVMVTDMAGFSRLTQRYGIVHYLSMVHRMQLASRPVVEAHHGTLIKFEADNCFATFPDTLSAVRAAQAIRDTIAGMNMLTPDDIDIQVSIGIDFGRVLVIDTPDFFGDAVNLASKLGEDLAGPGEILMTERAFALIPAEAGIQAARMHFSISGIELPAAQILP